jgi:hypothetical protein
MADAVEMYVESFGTERLSSALFLVGRSRREPSKARVLAEAAGKRLHAGNSLDDMTVTVSNITPWKKQTIYFQ